MRRRTGLWWGTAALTAALLTGCAPGPAGGGGTTETPDADPTPTAVATTGAPGVPVFRMPQTCEEIIGAETAARFAAEGRDLLGGPGDSTYGEDYFLEDTAEEEVGGITCVWGDEADLASTVVVSVAPVTTATRSGIVAQLIARGLIEAQVDGAITYSQIGDPDSAQALFNVIRTDSWISVLEAVGGQDRFEHATELVDDVTEQVYVVP